MGISISLFVLLHIWRLRSVIVHCSPSIQRSLCVGFYFIFPRVGDWLQVFWDCFGIWMLVAYPLLQFNFTLRGKRLKLIEHFNWFVWGFYRLDEIVIIGAVSLFCIALGILLCTWMQHRKHVLRCRKILSVAVDGVANTILSQSCLFTLDPGNIITNPFSISASIDCWCTLFRFCLLEFLLQWVKLAKGSAVVIWQFWPWVTTQLSIIVQLNCKIRRIL